MGLLSLTHRNSNKAGYFVLELYTVSVASWREASGGRKNGTTCEQLLSGCWMLLCIWYHFHCQCTDVNRTTTMLTLQNTYRRTAYMSGQLGTKKAKKQEYGQETFASFLAVSQERRLQVEKLSLF